MGDPLQVGKYAIVDEDGLAIGWANTIMGFCRQLATADEDSRGWRRVKDELKEEPATDDVPAHLSSTITLDGQPTRFTIELREAIEAIGVEQEGQP